MPYIVLMGRVPIVVYGWCGFDAFFLFLADYLEGLRAMCILNWYLSVSTDSEINRHFFPDWGARIIYNRYFLIVNA